MTSINLHELVGEPQAIELALAAGADPNQTDAAGNTPLHACAWPGNLAAARLLLAYGADAGARNRRGVPVLHEAVRRGRPEMAMLLARAGAATGDHADDDGSTPLHWAAKAGWTDFARFLLARGAAIDAPDRSGRTPLQWVLLRDDGRSEAHRDTIRLLLSSGASHPVETAVTRGGAEHVRAWLSRGTPPDARAADGGSLLALAAEKGDTEVLGALLQAGARPDGAPFDARSPLLRAVRAGRVDSARLLLAAGADPERGEGPVLPLDALVDRLYPAWKPDESGALLLAHGARPTPQWAVIQDDPAVLRAALAAGWDVNRAGSGGVTALLLATRANRPAIAQALLQAGADPAIADVHGQTPLHAAAEACEGRPRIAELLLAAGADPNAVDGEGCTPLHVALELLWSFCVNQEIVRILLAGGADPGVRDHRGRTPLEVNAGADLHHDVNGDPEETYGRMRAAVAAVSRMLEEAAAAPRAGRPFGAPPPPGGPE
ncbi:MAG: ankyrin repeat domain-containing protein [Gemmatimonadetes bacterium]|nr:ankyrin repeat domain-containing protein [Gemmatimonadota bacterium]